MTDTPKPIPDTWTKPATFEMTPEGIEAMDSAAAAIFKKIDEDILKRYLRDDSPNPE